ncbi:LINE-1 reverse transcriptase isogeny [Gossypium australe]|uniref:LINE-1 reverse transcriptase isogeny n=1 Tax=Gossypium australe TaxID=47621 RepID=A0A5B6UST4_9ROSI|nr:LINE-1 reverse transcriptase isogeny [Gossypium australe]
MPSYVQWQFESHWQGLSCYQSLIISCSLLRSLFLFRFILGRSTVSQKPSLVKWVDCCQPIFNGGLGLRSLIYQNNSFLLKLRFNFLSNKQGLWVLFL